MSRQLDVVNAFLCTTDKTRSQILVSASSVGPHLCIMWVSSSWWQQTLIDCEGSHALGLFLGLLLTPLWPPPLGLFPASSWPLQSVLILVSSWCHLDKDKLSLPERGHIILVFSSASSRCSHLDQDRLWLAEKGQMILASFSASSRPHLGLFCMAHQRQRNN